MPYFKTIIQVLASTEKPKPKQTEKPEIKGRWLGRKNKTVFIWSQHDCLCRKSQRLCKKEKNKIKRHLLLGRKAITNLDSILKNRDII